MSSDEINEVANGVTQVNIQPSNEDCDLINNILPSYHMYQSTVSKNLTPSQENFRVDPPMYEMTPINSGVTSSTISLSVLQSPNSEEDVEFLFPHQSTTFDEESAGIWENTVLANAHRLPNLTKTDNPISKNLEIDIKVTEKVCRKGVKPNIYDPSNIEFKQGDYIHGYVTIVNKSAVPIPFDMVYVVFEGITVVLDNNRGLIDTQKPHTVYKFLNMLDLFASWSYANIARLATDNGDPHDWCDGETDPYDNTVLSINVKRFFQPNVTYKRFFTFRVPKKLLDDTCEPHNFHRHIEVPPSIGVPRNALPPSVFLQKKDSTLRDFSFIDTSISYSIDARIVGKASEYKYYTVQNDQYVIAKEATCPIRIIPEDNQEIIYNIASINQEARLFYQAFVDTVKEKIELGKNLLNLPTNQRLDLSLSPVSSRDSLAKLRQLYDVADNTIKSNFSKHRKQFNDNICQYLSPFKKKSLTGSSKVLGIVSLSTPKQEYRISYVPPLKYRTKRNYDTKLAIPIELSYFYQNTKPIKEYPQVKSFTSELVVLTIRSKKYPIPVEFTHDMCFKDQEIDEKKKEIDNFDSIIIKKFQHYLNELTHLIKQVGNDLLKIETQLFQDLKSLAHLSTKYINLAIPDMQFYSKSSKGNGLHTSINTIPWELEKSSNNDYLLHSKNFDLLVDLKDCHLKAPNIQNSGFDHLTLVPSFQSCFMARLYYLKVHVKLTNGESLFVNVPVSIEN